jgi:hypothetical protein
VTEINTSLTPEVVEQRVTFRLKRQQAFFERDEPGYLDAIVTAGALALVVRSTHVMEAQIAHLLAIAKRGMASVRVLTATNGIHTAMRGPFTIMDFDDPDDPDLVYVENLIGSRYIERRDHVGEYRRAFEQMQAQAVPLEEYIA